MARFTYIVVLIAVASLSYSEAQDLEIKKDERQEVCKGGPYDQWENQASPCEKTCCKPQSGLCNFESEFGCRCQNGTLRNSRGICVSPDACPKNITKDNQNENNNNYPYNYKPFEIRPMCKGGRYDEWLGSFTTYEPNCEQPYVRFVPLGIVMRGCRCVSGTVRHKDGHCIHLGQCPNRTLSEDHEKKCLGGPNDQWVNNIDAHEGRCEYPNIGVPILLGSATGGCRCGNGTVRQNDGACVPPSTCKRAAIYEPNNVRYFYRPTYQIVDPTRFNYFERIYRVLHRLSPL